MKRFLLLLLSLSLCIPISLVGCTPKNETPDGGNETPAPEGDSLYTVVEPYLPTAVSAQMGALFEAAMRHFNAPKPRICLL